MMPPLLAEWVQKAEDDFEAAQVLSRRRKRPLRDAACFHCQQCVEKYLKAFLIAKGQTFRKDHDLERHLLECENIDSAFVLLRPSISVLRPYAVPIRYPGITARKTT